MTANPGSRRAFIAVVSVIVLLSSTGVPESAELARAVLASLMEHKILWICLGIALFEAFRGPTRELRVTDVAAAAPALLAVGTLGGWGAWAGLAVSAMLWRYVAPAERERRALMLLAALGAHGTAAGLCGSLAGDAWLSFDARVAAWIAGWFQPGIELSGVSLHAPDGITVILVWGCGSFGQVGPLLLLCWGLAMLQTDPRPRGIHAPGAGSVLVLLALAICVISLNGARIAMMTRSLADYEYLHGPDGSAAFRLVMLLVTAAMSVMYAHTTNRRLPRAV